MSESPYRFVGFTDLELADELARQSDWIYTRKPVTTKSREIAELMRTAANRLRPETPQWDGTRGPDVFAGSEHPGAPPRQDEQPWIGKPRSKKRR
jgi:hypothetical protein